MPFRNHAPPWPPRGGHWPEYPRDQYWLNWPTRLAGFAPGLWSGASPMSPLTHSGPVQRSRRRFQRSKPLSSPTKPAAISGPMLEQGRDRPPCDWSPGDPQRPGLKLTLFWLMSDDGLAGAPADPSAPCLRLECECNQVSAVCVRRCLSIGQVLICCIPRTREGESHCCLHNS